MSDFVTVHHLTETKLEYLIMAFGGWPDAAEGATSAVKYIQRKLGAQKIAEIDPEEFYDFTQTRPYSSRTADGRRRVHWPANEFFGWTGQRPGKGAMLFLGVEPNLRWRTYSRAVADLAHQCGVKTVVMVGALLDAVPHTRTVQLTGGSSCPDLQRVLDTAGIRSSNYQGPTGITTAVMEACTQRGMGYASLWGHTPHYLQAAPNFRVCHTLAQTLTRLLDLPLDLGELQTAATTFDEEVAKAIAKDQQLSSYVKTLEDRYDEALAAGPSQGEGLDPAEVVQELEKFLRSEQRRDPGSLPE